MRASRNGRRIALLAATLLTTSCAGPRSPLEAGVKEFPTDILIGSRASQAPRLVSEPVSGLDPDGTPLLIRPRRVFIDEFDPRPTPAPEACPENPLASPKNEAGRQPGGIVGDATYPFHNEGSYKIEGSEPEQGTFSDSTRKVSVLSTVVPDSSSFRYEVEDSLGVTTRYEVVFGDAPAATGRQGLYIVEIESTAGTDVEVFRPASPLKIVAFPIEIGAQLDSAGVSASGDTVMRFHTRVGRLVPSPDDPKTMVTEPKARVDACGTMLEGWWIDISDGMLAGPLKSLTFEAQLAIGTQYGTVPILERWKIAGQLGSNTVSSNRASAIRAEPKLATPR